MKNKKLLYLLVPLVLCIWGIIGYRIFSSMNDADDAIAPDYTQWKDNSSESFATDTFSLLLNYRNPFGNETEVRRSVNVKPASKTTAVLKTNAPIPKITYKGSIINKTSKQRVYLVDINGKSVFLQPGIKSEGIALKKVYNDSLLINYEGKSIIARR
jgi:hypothetical protein